MRPEHRRSLTRDDLERAAIPEALWRATYDEIPEAGRGFVGHYVARFAQLVSLGAGLLVSGGSGVGKSGLLAVVGKEARSRGKTVFYTTIWDLREAVRARTPFDDNETIFDRARGVDVLLLDNLRAEDATEMVFNRRSLEELLSERAGRGRPTFVSTRLSLRDLDDVKQGWKQMLGAGRLVVVPLAGPDRHAERLNALAAELRRPR